MGIKRIDGIATIRLNGSSDVWELTNSKGVTTRISRKHLFFLMKHLIGKLLLELTPAEFIDIAEWKEQTIKQTVEEEFIRNGFSWPEMEQWIKNCYKMQNNPMPALRRLFDGDLSDAVYFIDVLRCREYPKSFRAGLSCIYDRRNRGVGAN